MSRNNLQNIWQQQPIPQKSEAEILQKAAQYRRKKVWQLVGLNIQMLLTLTVVGWIWWALDTWFITTRLGMVLIALDVAFFAILYNGAMRQLIKVTPHQNVKHYLSALRRLQSRLYGLYQWGSHLYLFILALGLGLYLVEFTGKMPWYFGLITYVLSLGWVLWSWFYLRPRVVQKRKAELINQIQELEKLLKNDFHEKV